MDDSSRISLSTLLLRLLFLSLPLLLNDFYLSLVPEDATRLNLILDLIIYIGWQTSVIYFAHQAKWFSFGDLGISFHRIGRQIFSGLVLLLGVFLFVVLLTVFSRFLDSHYGVSIASIWYFPIPEWNPWLSFTYVIYLSITAGIYEEIIYRGIVITQLRQITESRAVQIVASAFLFALIHWSMGPHTWIISMVYGLFWGYLFIRYHSLLPIMISHFLFDVLSIYQLHERVADLFY